MKILFYDTKSYDKDSFQQVLKNYPQVTIEYTKSDLDPRTAALAEGDEVRLVGFGTFEVKKREARIGRNPATKEEIQIPATKVPAFKPGKALKEVVAK